MEYPPVLTKRQFVELYRQGVFGNAAPTWDTLEDFTEQATTPTGKELFHLRNRVAGGETHYSLVWSQLANLWAGKRDRGQWYASQMAPSAETLLQGEVMETERGLYLYYSRVRKPMREALAEQAAHAYGILAVSLLRWAMCPNSYEWLTELLRRYDHHVVEFSSFGVNWGTLPHFNSVFWEVRGGY